MAIAVRNVGTIASGTGTISPGLPSGTAIGDLLVMICESKSGQAVTASGWTQAPNSPQEDTTDSTRLTVLYQRAITASPATTTNDPGDHVIARIIGFSGVIGYGDPWDVTAGSTESTADTSGSIPGATTTRDGCMIVAACCDGIDTASNNTTGFSGWTNASLASITERIDNRRLDGDGGSIGAATGIKTTAGAYSATTVTFANTARKGLWSGALIPQTAGRNLAIPIKPQVPRIEWDDPITNGLVFDMPMTEGGGSPGEFVGGGRGVVTAATWTKDFMGPAMNFSGSSQYVNGTVVGKQVGVDKLTAEVMVKFNSLASAQSFFNKGVLTNGPFWGIRTDPGTNSICFEESWGNNPGWGSTNGSLVAVGVWTHIIITFDGLSDNTKTPQFYIDNVPKNSYAFAVAPTGSQGSDDGVYGVGGDVGSSGFNGVIAVARYWNRVLGPAERRALFENPWRIYESPGKYQSLNNVSTAVTVSPSHVAATGSIQAPTITANRSVTTTADQLAATGAIQSASVKIVSLATPSVMDATGTIQSPTISTVRNVTASPSNLSSTAAIQAPTVSTTRNALAAISVIDALASIQDPTVSTPVNVVADLLAAVGSLPSPTISTTRNVTVSPGEVQASLTIQVPTITGIQNTVANPAVLSLLGAIQNPTFTTTRNVTVSPAFVGATGGVQDPGIETSGNVDIAAATEVLLGLLEDPTVTAVRNVAVQVDTVQLTGDIEGPVITGIQNVTALPDPFTLAGSTQEPTIRAGVTIFPATVGATGSIEDPDVTVIIEHINVTIQAPVATLLAIVQDVAVKVQRRKALYSAGGNLYHRRTTELASDPGLNYRGRGELYKNNQPQG